ncbi:MAG: hypothetical protein ACQCN3_08080 [Candidatus Bathyarchaeia archaeon]
MKVIVITKAGMLNIMRKTLSLTNIDKDPTVDAELTKQLAKALVEVLQDLEE